MPVEPDKAHVCAGGTDYVCRVDPQMPLASLQVGQRVLLNEAFAIVQGLGFDRNGPIVRIDELLSGGRLRIGQESGLLCSVLLRSALAGQGKTQAGHGSAAGRQSARRAGGHRRGQTHRTLPGNRHRPAVGGDRRPGGSGAGDSRHHRIAVSASRLVQALRAQCAEGLSAARPARLRQNAAGQGHRLQSAPANPGRNGRGPSGVLSARQRAGNPEHVGGRIGAAGARSFCPMPRTGGGRLAGLFVHRRGGIHSGHAPGGTLQQHLEHAGADVLLGNGRLGAAAKCGRHPRLQPGRFD